MNCQRFLLILIFLFSPFQNCYVADDGGLKERGDVATTKPALTVWIEKVDLRIQERFNDFLGHPKNFEYEESVFTQKKISEIKSFLEALKTEISELYTADQIQILWFSRISGGYRNEA